MGLSQQPCICGREENFVGTRMKARPIEVSDFEIRDWLTAVKADKMAAMMMPNSVYAILRNEDLIDSEHCLSVHAENIVGGHDA